VSAEHAYDYAIVRIVPRVERGEQINVGVILSCPGTDFLAAAIDLDESRLAAVDAHIDLEVVRAHLDTIGRVCQGGADAGPIGELTQRERFRWLTAPRSTIIQMSPVHTGRTADPRATLAQLLARLVQPPRPEPA
jgi:hypothetical protein